MKIVFRNSRFIRLALSSYFFKKFRRRHSQYPAFPEHLDIEVTNACNLNCIMCPREKMDRRVRHMDGGLFKKICVELGENRSHLDKVSLHLYGEPLLNPQLCEMISELKGNGVPWVEFSTNCTLLDRSVSESLIDSGLDQIIFAVDGTNPETYARIRRGGDFDRIVVNIKEFFRVRRLKNASLPCVRLQIIVMTSTQSEIADFKQQWKGLLQKGDSFYIKKIAFNEFNRDLVCDKRAGVPYRVPCELFPYKNLTVYADGRVSICCYDLNGEAVVGDASSQTIREIWHGKKTKEFFRAHYDGDFSGIHLCDRCEWTTKYGEFELGRAMRFMYNKLLEKLEKNA